MTAAREPFKFFTPERFRRAYPSRLRSLEFTKLAKFVSWILVDHSESQRGSTYLLMSAKAYGAACAEANRVTHDVVRHEQRQLERDLNEQELLIRGLRQEVEDFKATQREFENERRRLDEELKAVERLKREFQGVLEQLKLDPSSSPQIKGMFERFEQAALSKHAYAAGISQERGKGPRHR